MSLFKIFSLSGSNGAICFGSMLYWSHDARISLREASSSKDSGGGPYDSTRRMTLESITCWTAVTALAEGAGMTSCPWARIEFEVDAASWLRELTALFTRVRVEAVKESINSAGGSGNGKGSPC